LRPLRSLTAIAALASCLTLQGTARAQSSPFLPETRWRALVNEISGDRAYEVVRQLTHYHRTGGSRDFFAATEYLRGAAEAAGLEEVKLIRQKWDGHGWSCRSGEAWLVDAEPMKLAAYGELAVSIADNSRTTHVTAELVDVGAGTSEKDYAGREVSGRVVLASGSLATVVREAVWKRGALGVVSSMTNRPDAIDAPDQVAWGHVPYEAKGVEGVKDATPGGFAVMISPRRGLLVQKRLATAAAPPKVKIDIESDYPAQSEQAMVEGWIRGSEIHDQQIVLTAHIQEEMTSANDDGSGCGNLVEIGRALKRLIADGTLPQPRRDIRFWWVNELSSEPQYFRDHPGEPRKMLVALNQDMVGARQSWGGRVQYASRLPWSLPHALEDVMESVLDAVRDGNTSYLTNRGTGQPQPYLKEIAAVKGSREPFAARMVPYFDSTDHHSFTPRQVGVPATSLTNWPDEFIHSTGDDLENIDATQLERNAVVKRGRRRRGLALLRRALRRGRAGPRGIRSRARAGARRRGLGDGGRPRGRLGAGRPRGGLARFVEPAAPVDPQGAGGTRVPAAARRQGSQRRAHRERVAPARGLARPGAHGARASLHRPHRQAAAQHRLGRRRAGDGREGVRAAAGPRRLRGRPRADGTKWRPAPPDDAVRGAELRRRPPQRLGSL
jgi:hypothetical protein